MAIELEAVQALKRDLEDSYRDQHAIFRRLRGYWWGKFWETEETAARTVSSIFRDLTTTPSDLGPDIKLVYNITQQICVKYQAFLSPLPQIRVYVDPPESERKRHQATVKQRYLYGCWAAGRMNRIFNRVGWYLPLMGNCFLGIHPDFERKVPTPVLRSPEHAYPIQSFDGSDLDALIFSWKVRESALRRDFPDYQSRSDRNKGRFRVLPGGRPRDSDPEVEYLEYSDRGQWIRWADGQKLNGVEHDYGFNLWQHLKFVDVPDEPWGHGAVEQAINLNEMGNALYSLLFQAVLENVFPQIVLIDPAKAPEELEKGPGAVWPVNAGGDVKVLAPAVQAIGAQSAFLAANEHNIKQATGMGPTDFGQSPVSSILTGKAVEELQGAGAGSMVEMVQGAGIGSGITSWNEQAIFLGQRMFREDKINLFGTEVFPHAINPRQFSVSIKGSELIGSPRNDVIFSPALNQHEKLVMWLQAKGGGLVSNKFIREQISIPDSEAMDEEIFSEAIEGGVLGAFLSEIQAEPTPQSADRVEQEAVSYLAGATPGPAGPGPAPAGPALPPGPPPGPGAPPSAPGALSAGPGPSGTASSPPLPLPQGAPPPQIGPEAAGPEATPQSPQGPQSGGVSLDNLVQALSQVQLAGRAFLVGEIVQRGETSQDIELAVTNPDDRDTITQALPQYAAQLHFVVVKAEPTEPHVEVGAGVTQQAPEAPVPA